MSLAHDTEIIRAERQLLRVLCQGFADGPLDQSARQRLAEYRWLEPEHEAIMRAIGALPPVPAGVIREHLPARLTRAGFPDARWEDLFQPHGSTRTDAEEMIACLLSSRGA